MWSADIGFKLTLCVCLCVCVCDRQRERERCEESLAQLPELDGCHKAEERLEEWRELKE